MIAIGGMGGSGTRVVAQILMDAGLHMGDDVNESNDNIWFTRLFKCPRWNKKASDNDIFERLDLFEKMMHGNGLSMAESAQFIQAGLSNCAFPMTSYQVYSFLKWNFSDKQLHTRFGWKEPNTQIYLQQIAEHFSSLKYIHVVRNGLEMAFATNRQQLKNWGHLFDIQLGSKPIQYYQLDYWIKSNQQVFSIGTSKMSDRFHIVNYNKLCSDPELEIERLVDFTGLEISKIKMEDYADLKSRSKRASSFYDESIFDEHQLKKIRDINLFSLG